MQFFSVHTKPSSVKTPLTPTYLSTKPHLHYKGTWQLNLTQDFLHELGRNVFYLHNGVQVLSWCGCCVDHGGGAHGYHSDMMWRGRRRRGGNNYCGVMSGRRRRGRRKHLRNTAGQRVTINYKLFHEESQQEIRTDTLFMHIVTLCIWSYCAWFILSHYSKEKKLHYRSKVWGW